MADVTPEKEESGKEAAEEESEERPEHGSEKRMPFLEHLEELRWHLIKSIVAIVVCAIFAWIFRNEVIGVLIRPHPDPDATLKYLSPLDPLIIPLKISLALGFVLALPVVIYQAWSFVAPGLLEKERKHIPFLVFFTFLCFATGASFAYFLIIPFSLKFLSMIGGDYLEAMITIDKFLSFVVQIVLGFGLVFEMPMLSLVLSRMGIIDDHFLKSKRAYGVVCIFIVAALLTPPEPSTQLMLALPLILLYEVSIWVARVSRRRAETREAEEEKADS